MGIYCFAFIKIGSLLRGAVKSAQLVSSFAFVHCSLTNTLPDPACAVYHSARSAGEISEVVLYHAIRKSHRLTSRKAVFPSKNANTSVVLFYCALCHALKANYVDTKEQ